MDLVDGKLEACRKLPPGPKQKSDVLASLVGLLGPAEPHSCVVLRQVCVVDVGAPKP